MGRPREHDESTRLALLDAAEALVAEGGLSALSVRAAADRIGSSVRAVYSLFGSKDGLVRGLAQRGFELLMDGVDSVPITDDPAADLAQAALNGFRPFALEHPDLFRLIFIGPGPGSSPNAGAAKAQSFARLTDRLERARAAGLIPNRPIGALALEFHALCQGLAGLELRGVMSAAQGDRAWIDAFNDLLAGWRASADPVKNRPGRQ
ncbi:MAG: TetR/AcrR family transcriptional regulator [Candidatus Dormibacteria bacterium]